jgi:GT2 family glycosyltransferase
VRIKYAPDRLKLFILSMQRQRYDNWELVAVTDGPNEAATRMVTETNDPRIRLIETEKRLGRWGNPYRQRGLDACRGDYIGMSNDDNYYVPGYIEQMLNALGGTADVVLCQALHSYSGWSVVPAGAGTDLGAWIARASLVRKVPWSGQDFSSDLDYLMSLLALAPGRVATVARPLFIHN